MTFVGGILSYVNVPDGANLLSENIRRRMVVNNKNFMAVWVGETGEGKSYSACTLARMIDPNFTIDNVVFNQRDLIKLIKKGELPKGSMIVYDEAGVTHGARQYWSVQNRLLNYVNQSIRFMNIGVMFTTPLTKFIDLQSRELLHAMFYVHHRDKEFVHTKAYRFSVNPFTGQVYHYPFRVLTPNGLFKLRWVHVRKPNAEFLKEYERKRRGFIFPMLEKFDQQLDALENVTLTGKPSEKQELKEKEYIGYREKIKDVLIRNPDVIVNKKRQGGLDISSATISALFDIPSMRADVIAKKVLLDPELSAIALQAYKKRFGEIPVDEYAPKEETNTATTEATR